MSDLRIRIADEISNIQVGSGYESTTIGITAALEAADALIAAGVVAEEPEGRRQYTAAYRAANGKVIPLETPNMLREAAERTVAEFTEEDPEGPDYFVATRIMPPWVPVKQEGTDDV
ncbi:hypothetical protein [Microbacterium maritypicum]|uniref:hypothetical protein n=1 Tax=Microbacterium maritypicum TaxID=33918 RepID=UPI003A9090F0